MESNSQRKHIGIVIAIIVVIAAIVCGLFIWMHFRNTSHLGNTTQLSDEDAGKMISLMDSVQEMDARGADTDEIFDYFNSLSWMETVCIEEDGSVSFLTDFGILGGWSPEEEEGYISGGSASSSAEDVEKLQQDMDMYVGDGLDIVIFAPFASEDQYFIIDGYERIADNIADMTDGSVTVLTDEEVSLDALKTMDEYDMIFYYAHGAINSAAKSGDTDAAASFTSTGQFVHSETEWEDAVNNYPGKQLAVNISTGRLLVGGDFYTSQFQKNAFQDMFFHYGSCYSMKTNTISNALLSLGASWVEGWDNEVKFNNDYVHLDWMTSYLMEGNSATEAFDLVQQTEEAQVYAQEDCNFTGAGEGAFQIVTEQTNSDAEEKENPSKSSDEQSDSDAEEKENPSKSSDEQSDSDAEEKENPSKSSDEQVNSDAEEKESPSKSSDEQSDSDAEEKEKSSSNSALFADMNGHQFYFMNGADIWNSYLCIYSDGTFEGVYSDWTSEGQTAKGKSYLSAYYYNEFSGRLSEPKQISEYIYSTTVLSLKTEYKPGTESMIDGSMHIFTEPYGIAKGDEIWIYLPETPVSELGGGLVNMLLSELGGESILGDYLLYNTSGTGIFL